MARIIRSIFLCCLGFLFTVASYAGSGHDHGSHAHHGGAHWGYEGEGGPSNWGDLKPEFAMCKNGKHQSPIDIKGAAKSGVNEIAFDYKASPLKVLNNGHTVQANYQPGSSITIGGKKFSLLQFHFHSPSENTVNGKAYDMEMHLVHKSEDGQLAVIGVFFEKGKENAELKKVWSVLPLGVGEEKASASVSATDLLPKEKGIYQFTGSLTTPPCSENVLWNVMQTPLEASAKQISSFISVIGHNARPVLPLNDRQVHSN